MMSEVSFLGEQALYIFAHFAHKIIYTKPVCICFIFFYILFFYVLYLSVFFISTVHSEQVLLIFKKMTTRPNRTFFWSSAEKNNNTRSTWGRVNNYFTLSQLWYKDHPLLEKSNIVHRAETSMFGLHMWSLMSIRSRLVLPVLVLWFPLSL